MKMKQFGKLNQQYKRTVLISSETEELSLGRSQSMMGRSWKIAFAMLLVLMGLSSSSFAQLQWGVKLGANASTQSEIGNICDDNGLRVGINTGVIAKYQFNNWLALKSGLDYQLKGKKCDISGEDSELKSKLSYLVLPVKAEFSASEKASFKNGQRLFFATGPYLGYLLDAKQITNGQTTDLNGLNNTDFGWSFELGLEFPVFRVNALQVSLNYDMGIAEIAEDVDMQNKTASLNLGFLF